MKEKFYEELSRTYETIPKQDAIVILRDANAQVGKKQYLKDIVGGGKRVIYDKTNDNG